MTRTRDQFMSLKRRGSVVVIVLWTIGVAAIITSSLQLFSYRQSMLGREALERVQARWAARAGLEDTLMVMTEHTERPLPDDARAMMSDMYYVSHGDTHNASYSIVHNVERDPTAWGGPMDEHSKMNINRAEDRSLLLMLDDMTLDVNDAIGDWIDPDNDPNMMGVERDYYEGLEAPYRPRNGPLRSIGELELIAGLWPRYFRNEDWNLNNRLDANEDDSARSLPPDEPDDILDGGWSSRLTVHSLAVGATDSGLPRLFLPLSDAEELEERLGMSTQQAQALLTYGRTPTNLLADLLFTPLPGSSGSPGASATPTDEETQPTQPAPRAPTSAGGRQNQSGAFPGLSREQLRAVLAETCIEDPLERLPGKMSLNTVPSTLLRDIFYYANIDEALADEIISMRQSRPQGMVSLVELLDIPKISTDQLRVITRLFDTRSSVFTVSARGRSWASGLEVEIIAVVDRSTVPVRILEYREQ
ncbi:MAG: type II secretion system protein GspK [Phycisphaerales bacterium]|nr:type II secretion system protein GspK [Phycisphaerales bacterium]